MHKCTFSPYILTFFHFSPYIFILPLLVPKPINGWHLSPCRQPINGKSICGWRRNNIILFFYTWLSCPKPSHVYVTWGIHHKIRHWKSPNQTWIPRIALSFSLKLSASLSNHLCHLKPPSSSTISQDLQPLQSPWSDGSKLFNQFKLKEESFIEVLMCWKTSVSHFMDSRQPWQKVLWLSKLLGISIWVFCFTGVRFFCLNSSLVVEVYFSIFLWFIIKCLVCISGWAKV